MEEVGLQRAIHFLAGLDITGNVLQMYQVLERSLRRRPHQCAHAFARGGEQEFDLCDRRRLAGFSETAPAPLVGSRVDQNAEHRGRVASAMFDVDVGVQGQVDRVEGKCPGMVDIGFRIFETAEPVVDNQLTGEQDRAVAEVHVDEEFLRHQMSNSSAADAPGARARLRMALRPRASPRVSSPRAMTRSNAVGNPSTSSSAR